MPNRTLVVALILSTLLGSCRTPPPAAEGIKPVAKVSAAQTRYKDLVEDRLGPLWYHLVKINEDALQVGTVATIFEIPAAGGPVRNLKITSNTGGRMDELIARRAIEQLRAPPVPREILDQIKQDYFVLEESFTVFDKDDPTPSPTPWKHR